MARARARSHEETSVEDYRHDEAQRLNNPEAGLARYETGSPPRRSFEYDPHLDPQLSWSGKAERTSFDVDAVSLHVHERLSTEAIVKTLRKERPQLSLFGDPELERDREVEFYRHEVDWVNRLVLGDSLVVMTSLLERERMAGQVQCIYVDPPYGINYNSNFQARISDRSPTETRDTAVTREPEQIQAYRDTWTLGVHSYLTYLRDRLLVARELLAEEGSIFVQIGPDNAHRVRLLLDEVFGADNACTMIVATTTSSSTARLLPDVHTHLLWYARNRDRVKYRQLYKGRATGEDRTDPYSWVELPDGSRRRMTREEVADPSQMPDGARTYMLDNLTSQGFRPNTTVEYRFDGRTFHPGANQNWKTTVDGLDRLAELGRLQAAGNTLRYVRFLDDLAATPIRNVWTDMGRAGFGPKKRYVVETVTKLVARCVLMTTDPGDLVLDPTCGSGTTAYLAERYGRRWITVDTSRVALALARERVLTSTFPYYRLRDDSRGVDGGLRYRSIRRVTLGSLAHDEPPEEIALYDQPEVDNSRVRVSGPFSVEALSRYALNPLQDDVPPDPGELHATGDHVRDLLDALEKRGIPVKGGDAVKIATLTRMASTNLLHAEGTTGDGREFAVSIGPRYGPVTMAQVDEALEDAAGYHLVVFAGFTATAEVQRHLARGRVGRYEVVLLEANADLLVGKLLRNTTSSQTFRLFAAPDVTVDDHPDGGRFVELHGVDVYDAAKGEASARTTEEIAAWFLDHDYDGECFHVCQAFFPKRGSWAALARALKGTLDEEALARLSELVSNPFEPGDHGRVAVRVIDDSGQTSEAVVPVD